MRSANRTIWASSVEGIGIDHGWCTMPSRTSQVRLRPCAVVLEVLDDAQRSARCGGTAARGTGVSACSPRWPNGRVAEVVAERDGLGEVLVEAQGPGARARDLRDVERVGEPHAVVVALGRQEHLGLVLEPAERLGMHDAIAVALEHGADAVVGLVAVAALGLGRQAPRAATGSRARAARFARGGWAGAHEPMVAAGTDDPRSRRRVSLSERRAASRSGPRRCDAPRSPSRLPR